MLSERINNETKVGAYIPNPKYRVPAHGTQETTIYGLQRPLERAWP